MARSWGPSSWRPASPAGGAFGGRGDEAAGVSKRHIGALARSGILPAFRSLRYSRSGRAVLDGDNGDQPGAASTVTSSAPRFGRLGPVRYRRICYYR